MRIGLIGYGTWGKAHAAAIRQIEGAELVSIAVPSEESRRAAQADHSVPTYADYREMLERPDLDVIDIVSPNYLHHEMAMAALQSGRDLILEKPMAESTAGCDEILALAEQKGKLIAIAHEYHFSPLFGTIRSLVEQGRIGKPIYLMFELWRRPFRQGASGWKQDPQRVLSWFLEEPIHYFDLMRWCFSDVGEPTRLYARASSKSGEDSVLHDNMSALVDFPGGAHALFSQSLCGWGHTQSIRLAGSEGSITAGWSGTDARATNQDATLTYFNGTETEEIAVPMGLSQGEQIMRFIGDALEAFGQRRLPRVSGKDGRASVAMCEAAENSIRLGEPVIIR